MIGVVVPFSSVTAVGARERLLLAGQALQLRHFRDRTGLRVR